MENTGIAGLFCPSQLPPRIFLLFMWIYLNFGAWPNFWVIFRHFIGIYETGQTDTNKLLTQIMLPMGLHIPEFSHDFYELIGIIPL